MLFSADNTWPGDALESNWGQVKIVQHDDADFYGIEVCFNHDPADGDSDEAPLRIKGMKALLAWTRIEDGEEVRSDY